MPGGRFASSDRTAVLAWVAVCIIWGTTYFAIKIALESVPPFLIGGLRYVLAGGSLALYLVARGQRLPLHAWRYFVVTGGLLLGIGNGGVVVAEQWVPSGLAAVVIATTPFWMVGLETLQRAGDRPGTRQWVGLVVGFGGILLLVWPDLTRGGAAGWRFGAGVVALQTACAAWALGSSISKRHPARIPPVQTAALQMLAGGVWMMAAGTALGEWRAATLTWRSGAAVLYLAYIGGLAGFASYIYALSRLPVSFVSLYAYVNPIIAVALGTLLLDEPFSLRTAMAIGIVLCGLVLASRTTDAGSAAPGRQPAGER
jgi:drug/metabolite transporter (DMT)-like permease